MVNSWISAEVLLLLVFMLMFCGLCMEFSAATIHGHIL